MAQKIIRKLTIRDVIGGKAQILAAALEGVAKNEKGVPTASEGTPVDLLTVIGQVHSVAPGESDNGPYAKLKGSFEAINLMTGEVMSNVAVAILPNFVSEGIVAALKEGAESVQFAIKLTVSYKENAATSYEFGAESLLPSKPSDALESIKALMASSGIELPKPREVKQLAAPAAKGATEKPEPAPAAAPAASNKKQK